MTNNKSMQSPVPKVSVIIPVHNTESYLYQCLSSIIKQSFGEWELICIDDGSTDGSLNIMRAFANEDCRIKIIVREVASGSAAVPRNMGLAQARGKYVIFLDSDDYFDNHLLEKLYIQAENVEADLVMCDNYVVDNETGEIKTEPSELHVQYLPNLEIFSYRDIPKKIFQISNASAWHRLIRKKMLDDTGLVFQENTPSLDDMFFVNAVLIMAHRVSVVRERLVYYRQFRPGAQTTQIAMHKESLFKVFDKLNSYLVQQDIYYKVKESLQCWTLDTMYWWLYSINDYEIFVKLYGLYQREYIKKLKLLDVKVDRLREDVRSFYCHLINDVQLPFPFNVLKGVLSQHSRIALYGAGRIGKRMYDLISGYDQACVSVWCDKNAIMLNDPRIKLPIALKTCKYDAIIIAIRDENIINEVKRQFNDMGIVSEKIFTVND